jgi:hypothetical protein
VIDATHLLLNDLDHRVLHGLRRGAGIRDGDGNGGRRDARILRHRQFLDREDSGQGDDDGNHPGEVRAVDEES